MPDSLHLLPDGSRVVDSVGIKLNPHSIRINITEIKLNVEHVLVPDRLNPRFAEMQHRIVTTLDRLRAEHRGGTIVCVSHADPIKAAVAHALGTHLDLFQRIVISTCAISVIAVAPGGPVVLAVNSTGGSLKELRVS